MDYNRAQTHLNWTKSLWLKVALLLNPSCIGLSNHRVSIFLGTQWMQRYAIQVNLLVLWNKADGTGRCTTNTPDKGHHRSSTNDFHLL